MTAIPAPVPADINDQTPQIPAISEITTAIKTCPLSKRIAGVLSTSG